MPVSASMLAVLDIAAEYSCLQRKALLLYTPAALRRHSKRAPFMEAFEAKEAEAMMNLHKANSSGRRRADICADWQENMWTVFALVNSLLVSTSIVPFTKDNLHPVTFIMWAITLTWNALTLLVTLLLYGTMLAQRSYDEERRLAEEKHAAVIAQQTSKGAAQLVPQQQANTHTVDDSYYLHMSWAGWLPLAGTLGGALAFVASILSYVFTDVLLHTDEGEEENRAAIDGVFWTLVVLVGAYFGATMLAALECRWRVMKAWLEGNQAC